MAVDKAGIAALKSKNCAAEARAFRAARRAFGNPRFDRMLYETVASSLRTSFSADTDFALTITSALQREERCQ